MNELKVFNSQEFGEIRTIEIEGEPWFVGKDVAVALGYTDTAQAIRKHADEEDKGVVDLTTPGGIQKSTVINESGLYSLVLSSKLPTAKKFKRWVTGEVLPAIRKTGLYATQQLLDDPELAIRAFTALKEERERRRQLEEQIHQDRPRVLFAQAVEAANTSILVGELAKLLKQNGVEMGQNRLFAWLRQEGYLIRRQGSDYNMPTQRSMEQGLFELKETAITHSDGHIHISRTPKVTGKGQAYFVNLFLAKQ